ncbi:MAG: ABC transporter substrate-binding protein [Ignavibacteria bacterium GWB2_35_6b]|nr:MAG: ABC transporter substrate-binding protein [Ignavibacteria bacterium GWB2_35_6b]
MKNIERRDFIKKAAVAAVGSGALLNACSNEKKSSVSGVVSGETFEWKMVTAWPPHYPILGEGADKLAKEIEEMSAGRLKIKVYGGGELVPALESFDAVSQGVADMCHSASYYWAGKAPAAQFFTAIPFGMNTQQAYSWLYYGGGIELWKEVYEPFNIIPFPAGGTGAQMGGWFNKQINSVSDLKGLKMRIPGIGGKVLNKAGGSSVLSAGGEIYTNLERGVIDAAEWVGPYHDYLMGFHKIAKYYYYPGWQEPASFIELIVNKNSFSKLPDDLKKIIEIASTSHCLKMFAEFENKNAEYRKKLIEEEKVDFRKFPDDVLKTLKKYTEEVLNEIAASDPMSKKVFESYKAYNKSASVWTNVAEHNYSYLK